MTSSGDRGDRPARLDSPLPCEPRAATLVEALRRAAAEVGDRLYLNLVSPKGDENRLAFADVLTGAEHWANAFLARGIARGDRVALILPTSEAFVAAFFGAQMAGGVPVPCPFPVGVGDVEPVVMSSKPVMASAKPKIIVTKSSSVLSGPAGKLADGLDPAAQLMLADDAPPEDRRPGRWPEVGPDDLAMLQYSSGPVLNPHGAALTHKNVLSNVEGLGRAIRMSEDDVALCWVPLVHDMGLVGGLFTTLYWRCPMHMMPPQAFLMHPHSWLENISKYGATISVAPNAAYQMCVRRVRDRHTSGLDLSRWRLALNGAETVYPETAAAFTDKFAGIGLPKTAVRPIYGLAENSLVASCFGLDGDLVTVPDPGGSGRDLVSVGQPLAGQRVRITDSSGQTLGEDEVGQIQVAGPCVMRGYFDDRPATESALADGWLRTGDLGFVSGDHLYVSGRTKDIVIKLGRNYYCDDLERTLEESPAGLANRAVAYAAANARSGTDDLVLFVETAHATDGDRRLPAKINADLLSTYGIRADRLVVLPPGGLPSEGSRAERRELMRRR